MCAPPNLPQKLDFLTLQKIQIYIDLTSVLVWDSRGILPWQTSNEDHRARAAADRDSTFRVFRRTCMCFSCVE
jgi:hypothetical protein